MRQSKERPHPTHPISHGREGGPRCIGGGQVLHARGSEGERAHALDAQTDARKSWLAFGDSRTMRSRELVRGGSAVEAWEDLCKHVTLAGREFRFDNVTPDILRGIVHQAMDVAGRTWEDTGDETRR